MKNDFETLGLDRRLLDNLSDLNFKSMTPIQEKSLPLIMENKDIIAKAKTGSGKTVAFGLGIINKINVKQTRPQTIILCPVRELAEQVATELRKLARTVPNIKILSITGGKSEYQQEKSLAHGAHIIVGTPGRTLKLLKKKILSLSHVNHYILDEADRMLDMGFSEDIFAISTYVPENRQTLLFSATFPSNIKDLSSRLQKNAIEVSIDNIHDQNIIKEEFIELDSHKNKIEAVFRVLAKYQPKSFIIFCKTKRITDDVADDLYDSGIAVDSIHGDLEQNDRTEVITKFSSKCLCGIVATDVAARGIDIKDLDLVINFDLPNDPEDYVHRIGRTGRAGNQGRAISLFVSRESESFNRVSDYQEKVHEILSLDSFNSEAEYNVKPLMSLIYISGGKKDKLRPGDIVGAIVGESGVDFKEIGEITLTNVICYVAIKNESADLVSTKLNSGKIKNKKFKVGILS